MNKSRTFLSAAAFLVVLVLGGLRWYHRTQDRTEQSEDFHTSSQAESLADLTKKLDGIKLDHAAAGQGSSILTKAGLERLLAKKAALTVQELRLRLAAGTQSPDPLDRARAHLLKGDCDAALKTIASVKVIHPGDLLAVLEVKAQAYEGMSRHQDSLAARRRIAGLTDRKKDPVAWATAQRMAAEAGKTSEQEPFQPEAGVMSRPGRGEEPSGNPPGGDNLPGTPRGQGNSARAMADQRPAPDFLEQVPGFEHPGTRASRNNPAVTLQEQGQIAAMVAEKRAAFAELERRLGPEHPRTLASRNSLAIALNKQGKNTEAAEEFRAVITVQERVLGPEHRDTLNTRNNLAVALRSQGNRAEAEAENRAVLAVRERVFGTEHPDTLQSRFNLGNVLLWQGKNAEAEAELRAVVPLRERVLGPDHPDTLTSRFNLALCLANQGEEQNRAGNQAAARAYWADALEHARTVQASGPRVFGENTPNMARSDQMVAKLEAQLKE